MEVKEGFLQVHVIEGREAAGAAGAAGSSQHLHLRLGVGVYEHPGIEDGAPSGGCDLFQHFHFFISVPG